jgi:acyl-coenzyme A thioesterase PaaI-like protein
MYRYLIVFVFFMCLGACTNNPSRTSEVRVQLSPLKAIVISGFFTKDAFNQFLLLGTQSDWKLPIELNVCEGGELEASIRLAAEIRNRKLNTRAGGYVASGCAYAFLAGSERTQVENMNLMLHFHAPSQAGKPIRADEVSSLMDDMETFTEGKFPGSWRQKISSTIGEAGVFFTSFRVAGKQIQQVMICDRKVVLGDKLSDACRDFQSISFDELGLTKASKS